MGDGAQEAEHVGGNTGKPLLLFPLSEEEKKKNAPMHHTARQPKEQKREYD